MPHELPVVVRSHTGLPHFARLVLGLPVVTPAVGGATEVVNDACGILVPPHAAALAAALHRLIHDATLRQELGAAGPARAIKLCNPATQMQRLALALSRVVGTGVVA